MKEKYFDKALQFAIKAHRGQKRKWTTIPYILHPIEVCAIVATLSDDDEVLSAALLHDTVEDTDVTMEDIRANFSEKRAKNSIAERSHVDVVQMYRAGDRNPEAGRRRLLLQSVSRQACHCREHDSDGCRLIIEPQHSTDDKVPQPHSGGCVDRVRHTTSASG